MTLDLSPIAPVTMEAIDPFLEVSCPNSTSSGTNLVIGGRKHPPETRTDEFSFPTVIQVPISWTLGTKTSR